MDVIKWSALLLTEIGACNISWCETTIFQLTSNVLTLFTGLGVINAFNLSQTEENGTSHLSTAFTLKVKTIAIMEKLYSLLLNTCTCIFCFNAFLKNKHRENFKLILYRKVIFTFLFKNDPMNIWSGNRRLYFVFASCKSSLLAHHPNHSYNHL